MRIDSRVTAEVQGGTAEDLRTRGDMDVRHQRDHHVQHTVPGRSGENISHTVIAIV